MQPVFRDRARPRAVRLRQLLANVRKTNGVTIVEQSQLNIHTFDMRHIEVELPLVPATRKNAQHQHLGRRASFPYSLDHLGDPLGDGDVLPVKIIVRADQDHGDLGRDALHLAVLHAPQQVFHTVTADTEVDGSERFIACLEIIPRPPLRDGIAEEHQVDPASLRTCHIIRV